MFYNLLFMTLLHNTLEQSSFKPPLRKPSLTINLKPNPLPSSPSSSPSASNHNQAFTVPPKPPLKPLSLSHQSPSPLSVDLLNYVFSSLTLSFTHALFLEMRLSSYAPSFDTVRSSHGHLPLFNLICDVIIMKVVAREDTMNSNCWSTVP